MSAPDVFEAMRAESEEIGRRRGIARIDSTCAAGDLSVRGSPTWEQIKQHYTPEAVARRAEDRTRDEHEAMRLIQDRDPCFTCGVRKDRHDESGCKRWRG